MFTILRNRSFRNLWLAGLLSVLGTQVSRIGLVLHLFETRSSVVDLALLVVLETLPGALAAPLAGVVVDRLPKRSVLVGANLVRTLLMTAVLLWPTLTVIYLMAALNSVVTAFFQPAKAVSIPLVIHRDEVVRANGLDQSASSIVMIVGPVIGAQLLLRFGLSATLLVDAGAFLLGAMLAARVSVRSVEPAGSRLAASAILGEIREGWRYLVGHRLALHLSLLLFTALVCTGVWPPLAPFFIRDHLGGSDDLLGWQLGVFGCGTVLGGLWAPRLVERYGKGVVLYVGLLCEGLTLGCYALTSQMEASMMIIFLWGVVVSVIVVPFYSILQLVVEEQFLGRIFSVMKQSEDGAMAVSMLAVVLLQTAVSSHLILLGTGALYVAVILASTTTTSGRALFATR